MGHDAAHSPSGSARAPWGRFWAQRPRALQALAVGALVWIGAYLVWRIGWSLQGANPWLWGSLLAAELYGFWSLLMLTWFGWRIRMPTRPPATLGRSVDVYVCTFDEREAILRATLTGCAALRYPHTTWVLDDGRRPAIRALADEFGAGYLTREDNAHAKAGNINAALPRTNGELVLILDADHVPLPDALDAIVGHFDDPRVALVQTPHDFSNHDSIQHYEVGRHEQSIFYGVVQPGKDRHGAAFWCGSAGMIQRAALLSIGGVATETIAEDFHTTIRLHARGWISRYHDEVLVQGLAPHDLASYLLQRDRWARGNLAVFRTPESPLRRNGLTRAQHLSYFASLTSYLAGPARVLMLGVLAAVLWTGQLPLHATLLTITVLWLPATALSLAAGSGLGRGLQTIADTTHFELLTAEIHGRALRCAIRPGRADFRVTPKESIDLGGWAALRQLRLLLLVGAVLATGLSVCLLGDAGLVDWARPLPGLARWIVPLLGVIELARVLRTLRVVAGREQLRSAYRTPAQGLAQLRIAGEAGARDLGTTARVVDLSPTGIGLHAPLPLALGSHCDVTVDLHGALGLERVQLGLTVRRCRELPDGWLIGGTLDRPDPETDRHLVEACAIAAPWRRLRGADEPHPKAPAAARHAA